MITVKNITAMIKYLKVIQSVAIINRIYFGWFVSYIMQFRTLQ